MNRLWKSARPLILASASGTRRDMLTACGIPLVIDAAHIDERAVEGELLAQKADPSDIAATLARAKARAVSARHPGSLVLGADQVLDFEGRCFSKAANLAALAGQLAELSGKGHRLISAACLWRDGAEFWSGVSVATLAMRALSPDFIQLYVAACGPAVLSSVGGYQIEAFGIHLFAAIDGDLPAVLGLPLLQLLDALRTEGSLAS